MTKDGSPEGERKKLTHAETMSVLTDAVAKAAVDKIDQMGQRLSNEAANSDSGNLDPERANLLKKQLAPTLSLATQRATAGIEKAYKDAGPILDAKALTEFKANQKDYASKIAGFASTKDFSGGKEKIAEQIGNLKSEVNSFKDNLKTSPSAKAEVVNKEASSEISPTSNLAQKQKEKSSIETWNLLVEKAAEVALKEFNEISKGAMTPAMIAYKNEKLSPGIQKTFETEIESLNSKLNLDPKTVDAFKKNSEAYFKEMLKNSETSIEAKTQEFTTKTTIDPNDIKSNWKTVGEFLKSKNMDRLAEFCNDKHIETAAKKISKELDKNLSKDHNNIKSNSNVKYYKPHGTDHGM